CPKWVKEFLLTHPLYKSPKEDELLQRKINHLLAGYYVPSCTETTDHPEKSNFKTETGRDGVVM
ncbi:MAG: hypothetical protein MJ240_03250, partial [Kiritimatiellae bacterium]|nr:hypothetical protein [Kiritimatiellia bacterium]